jgi:hypothetical protein
VGRELGVRYVLEGSLRKSVDRIRISGRLIDALTAAQLWADHFESAPDEIFGLQDRMTTRVVSAIAPRLEQAVMARAAQKPTENLNSYDYFLRGMASLHQWKMEDVQEALQLFYRAIELDPKFASSAAPSWPASMKASYTGSWCWTGASPWNEAHPLRRLGTIEDVAQAALYLASDNAAWVTGVVLDVAGGAVMG